MTEAQKIARAKRRVEILTGFYIHAAVFLLVMAALFGINVVTGSDWWVHWAAIGWGLGVLFHALLAFGRLGERLTAWQMRKIYQLKSHM